MPILTVIDTTGIQSYIFGSNRLRENIGASEIVARATSDWVYEVLRDPELNWKTNLKPQIKNGRQIWREVFEELDEIKAIEKDKLDAEVVYAGGGNTVIIFAGPEKAKMFAQCYSKRLLTDAPGLEVVIVHSGEFEMDPDCEIRDAHDKARQRINEKKANRLLSAPVLGLSVTAWCHSTGGVAVELHLDKEKYPDAYISAETQAKVEYRKRADKRLKEELFKKIDRWKYFRGRRLEFPYDFDNLGRTKGEASFIAVVHTDGNGVGKRVKDIGETAANSREWVKKLRGFSHEINKANRQALREMLSLLLDHIHEDKDRKRFVVRGDHGEEFDLSENLKDAPRRHYLPLRPLIFGGEDVAFVCDGRLGLALTAYYLKQLEQQTLHSDEKPLFARAGIAIVKAHYPFARAYSLAEDLAKSAKKRIEEVKDEEEAEGVYALDWHIAMSGLAGGVDEIRRREYAGSDGELMMRPLTLHPQGWTNDWRSWESFEGIVEVFLKEEWKERRNKLKALRDALRRGEKATEQFITFYRLDQNDLPNLPKIGEKSWWGSRCVWFDALEALDLFFPLKNQVEDGKP